MSGASSREVRQLIDRALDGTLDAPSKSQLVEVLRTDPVLLASFESERRTLGALKQVVQPRDLTDAILLKVQGRRSFLSRSARLRVWGGRAALAASLLLAVGGIAVLQRVYPRAAPWSSGPGPVAGVERTVRSDAASGLLIVDGAVREMQRKAAGPLVLKRPELALVDSAGYERPLNYGVESEVLSASGRLSAREFRAWKLGLASSEAGFVRASWTDRSAGERRALRTDWECGAAMHLSDDASAIERSWWLRFWMNSQPAPGADSPPGR